MLHSRIGSDAQVSPKNGREPGAPRSMLGSVLHQREVYRDLGFDGDRGSIQQIRAVLPLLHRVYSCRRQHGMAGDEFEAGHVAGLADLSLQYDASPNSRFTGGWRINGL